MIILYISIGILTSITNEKYATKQHALPARFQEVMDANIYFPEVYRKQMWENHLPPPPKQQYRLDSFDPFEEAKANRITPATLFLEAHCRYCTKDHIRNAFTCFTYTHKLVSAAAGVWIFRKGHCNPTLCSIFQIWSPWDIKKVVLWNKIPQNIETTTMRLWNSW